MSIYGGFVAIFSEEHDFFLNLHTFSRVRFCFNTYYFLSQCITYLTDLFSLKITLGCSILLFNNTCLHDLSVLSWSTI
jgi:hypothetical protein